MKLDLQRAHESLGRDVPSVFPLHLRGEMRQQSARKNLSDERRRGLCGVARPGLAVESQDVSAFAPLAQALAEAVDDVNDELRVDDVGVFFISEIMWSRLRRCAKSFSSRWRRRSSRSAGRLPMTHAPTALRSSSKTGRSSR